ncbi:MAG: alpha/beta hydrolase [candidate division WOR-3 bacterium]|nr:alpha/beta hydrolase [candidate division WOR-3 bacterium]
MRLNRFRYLNRGYSEVLVLIPGWGFDARIFEPLNLDFNYILPEINDLEHFSSDLMSALVEKDIKRVSLLGWSMGGFLAVNFLEKYGREFVQEILLISMRKSYPKKEIDSQIGLLIKDRRLYLNRFYRNCFMGQKNDLAWFKEHLFPSYIEMFDLEFLLKGLDYLMQQRLKTATLKESPVRIIHGAKDRIAPCSGIVEIAENISFPGIVIFEKSGHLPFLEPDFKKRLCWDINKG